MENKAEMGELALFMVGALLSLLLLAVLFFPFVTRFEVLSRVRVAGLGGPELLNLLGSALARLGFSVERVRLCPDPADPGGSVLAESGGSVPASPPGGELQTAENKDESMEGLRLVRGSNTFFLRAEPLRGGAWNLHLAQRGLGPKERARMTVLTGTALGWYALRVDTALKRARLSPLWSDPEGQRTAGTPVSGLKRPVVALSPWH